MSVRVRIGLVVVLATLGILAAAVARSRTSLPVAEALTVSATYWERVDTLRRNETLSHLFGRHGITGVDLQAALKAVEGIDPRSVRAGQVFQFRYASTGPVPERVRAPFDADRVLWLWRDSAAGWRGEWESVAWSPQALRAEGTIQTSLYESLRDAIPDSIMPRGETDRLTYDLADNVFAWEIDFATDFYPGDRYQLLFERLISSEGKVRYGRLVAATIHTRGVARTAYVMSDGDGRNAYYDAEGRSLRRAFKRAPVPYRVTSRFSSSRFHPVLKEYRAHLGTDYRAPLGTPVEVTGDGLVTRAGRWGGYGLMVSVRHANGIETRYAHLSRLAQGMRPGLRITQGRVVGFSGTSGLATGPHVHYEFLKNGRQTNPRSVDVGNGEPVPAARRAEFEALRYRFDRLLRGDAPHIFAASAR